MEIISINSIWNKQTKHGQWSAHARNQHFFGSASNTTNQRMQLTALIKAIESLPVYYNRTKVEIATPSQYLTYGMKNFRDYQEIGIRLHNDERYRARYDGRPVNRGGHYVENLDLWQELIRVGKAHNIVLTWAGK